MYHLIHLLLNLYMYSELKHFKTFQQPEKETMIVLQHGFNTDQHSHTQISASLYTIQSTTLKLITQKKTLKRSPQRAHRMVQSFQLQMLPFYKKLKIQYLKTERETQVSQNCNLIDDLSFTFNWYVEYFVTCVKINFRQDTPFPLKSTFLSCLLKSSTGM